MITKLLLHPRTFLIAKNGVVPALLVNNVEVLGKNNLDEYVYKKILFLKMFTKKYTY